MPYLITSFLLDDSKLIVVQINVQWKWPKVYIVLFHISSMTPNFAGSSWSSSYGSWIYNYLYNQCLSPLNLLFRTSLRRDVSDTTLCDQV